MSDTTSHTKRTFSAKSTKEEKEGSKLKEKQKQLEEIDKFIKYLQGKIFSDKEIFTNVLKEEAKFIDENFNIKDYINTGNKDGEILGVLKGIIKEKEFDINKEEEGKKSDIMILGVLQEIIKEKKKAAEKEKIFDIFQGIIIEFQKNTEGKKLFNIRLHPSTVSNFINRYNQSNGGCNQENNEVKIRNHRGTLDRMKSDLDKTHKHFEENKHSEEIYIAKQNYLKELLTFCLDLEKHFYNNQGLSNVHCSLLIMTAGLLNGLEKYYKQLPTTEGTLNLINEINEALKNISTEIKEIIKMKNEEKFEISKLTFDNKAELPYNINKLISCIQARIDPINHNMMEELLTENKLNLAVCNLISSIERINKLAPDVLKKEKEREEARREREEKEKEIDLSNNPSSIQREDSSSIAYSYYGKESMYNGRGSIIIVEKDERDKRKDEKTEPIGTGCLGCGRDKGKCDIF